jgi:hypothetical protein
MTLVEDQLPRGGTACGYDAERVMRAKSIVSSRERAARPFLFWRHWLPLADKTFNYTLKSTGAGQWEADATSE